MQLLRIVWPALVWAILSALPAAAVPIVLGTSINPQNSGTGLNQGWLSNQIPNDVTINSNYSATFFTRNFFGFDTSGLAGMTVNSVQLFLPDGQGTMTDPQLFELRSVDPTLLPALANANAVDFKLYNALASGSLYGSLTQSSVSSGPFLFDLNSLAVASLQAAALSNQFFVMGGSLPRVEAGLDFGTLFGFSGGEALLLVDASPGLPQAAPEISAGLATIPMALWFGGMCLLHDRRQRK